MRTRIDISSTRSITKSSGGLRKLRIQKRRQRGLIHQDAHGPALFPPVDFAANLPWAVTKDKGETGVSETLLLREDQGAVTYLTMNSPGNLNALSDAMLAELTTAFRACSVRHIARDRAARRGQGVLRRPRPQGDDHQAPGQ
jgi:hypothetical protein